MVTAQDVEQVEAELQELRTLLMTARDRVRPRVNDLYERTERLRADDRDCRYQPTLTRVHDLLLACRRGFEVNDYVRQVARVRAGH